MRSLIRCLVYLFANRRCTFPDQAKDQASPIPTSNAKLQVAQARPPHCHADTGVFFSVAFAAADDVALSCASL